MKVIIPVQVEQQIRLSIHNYSNFKNNTELQNIKLYKLLISLWFFIYQRQQRDDTILNLRGYTNIHVKHLKKFKININKKTYSYNYLLGVLITSKLVNRNGKYKVGNFTQSYKINTNVLNGNYEEVEVNFDKLIHKLKNKKHWVRKYSSYKKHIRDCYDVKVDLSDYALWLRKNKGIKLKPIIKKGIVIERTLNEERIFDYLNTALKVNLGNLWFTISEEGRFYNTITNMSYTALPFIKLKGKKVIEIDVKNCQPLLLATIINNVKYKKDVEEGVFYDNMAKKLNMKRDKFKVLSYKYIFFSNKKLNSGKIYVALNNLYPGFIDEINRLREEINISRELQKLESQIMVNAIGDMEYKMMLRHDAVFVYKENYKHIRNQVNIEFSKLGLKVQIK
jgi:hypothetical protein